MDKIDGIDEESNANHDHNVQEEEECGDSESDDDKCHDNFADAFVSLIKSQNVSKCTHLDLSGILALGPDNIIEVMSEVFDY